MCLWKGNFRAKGFGEIRKYEIVWMQENSHPYQIVDNSWQNPQGF